MHSRLCQLWRTRRGWLDRWEWSRGAFQGLDGPSGELSQLPFGAGLISSPEQKSYEEELLFVDVDLDILNVSSLIRRSALADPLSKDARDVYGIRRDLISKLKEQGRLPDGVEP